MFDVTFMIDRIMDLLVGYYRPNGAEEHRLSHVIYSNLSSKFFIEIIVIVCPIIMYKYNSNSLLYLMFKAPRYIRLFEISGQINEILEYYAESKTVFEIIKL